ncbi:MAG: DNA-directed RNA polymerase subunit beta' [bacterium]|nr:DNA-directed RNA polymerase subunit beta' [bacterium]
MIIKDPNDFEALVMGIASPERILYWSYGEVEKPETINYRTFKPERKGLFCEKVFGPVKDWECSCGKYRRIRYRGIVCERCGVEVTNSKVRRERMGHIQLAADVAHVWFFKGGTSYMSLLLNISARSLEEVIYYDSYIVTEVDPALEGIVALKQILSIREYADLVEEYPNQFKAEMGASAIKKILSDIVLDEEVKKIREQLSVEKGQKRLKIIKRLRIVEAMLAASNRPEWMILEALPVMPPDLRPMVQLEGGRFATSDLNDLYRRVVNRNNRLKRLLMIGAPDMIVSNEKRMLQESVDSLIANGKRGRSINGANGRPLKSLSSILEGKQGRFRQNLLGKRVDYSGRSVIVVGPNLKFHQCGLPKEMAVELFKPMLIHKLIAQDKALNVKAAKRMIELRDIAIWDVLESVIVGYPVLLNRAPTLHRLGIQAFEPVLVEGSAIQVHPLVCTAFNADFDGDQMAVHVPLSVEAQTETRLLIMATNNVLSPSTGQAIITPSQDMVLGCYFLTVINNEESLGAGKYFGSFEEAIRAWESGYVNIQAKIILKDCGNRYETSVGRIIFNQAIRDVLGHYDITVTEFINETIGKKQLGNLIYDWFVNYGNRLTSALSDHIKTIGFKYSTLSGISISVSDLKIPGHKPELIEKGHQDVQRLYDDWHANKITEREKNLRVIDTWRGVTAEISDSLSTELGYLNNVYIMANSGARGNMDQVRQLSGMRGLMSDSQGRILEIPITSNFKEGLRLTEYFNACYGARKGLVDTALRTADSGYLTRRLVDVVQDVIVTIEDCGTKQSVYLSKIVDDQGELIVSLEEQIYGRVLAEDVVDSNQKVVVEKGQLIDRGISQTIAEVNPSSVAVRHVYRCDAESGVCQKCYGMDLARIRMVSVGEAVGIIAAQSIGEPGTQLTMRTFHTGGVDLRKASRVEIKSNVSGTISFSDTLLIQRVQEDADTVNWIATNSGTISVTSKSKKPTVYEIKSGTRLHVKPDDTVKKDDVLAVSDNMYNYVFAQGDGEVYKFDVDVNQIKSKEKGLSAKRAVADGEVYIVNRKDCETYVVPAKTQVSIEAGQMVKMNQQLSTKVVVKSEGLVLSVTPVNNDIQIVVAAASTYRIIKGSLLFVDKGDQIRTGDALFREFSTDSEASKTTDIVQGLPRVEELFEARSPKVSAVISPFDGVVDIQEREFVRVLLVKNDADSKSFKLSPSMRLKVFSGQRVTKGMLLTEGVIDPKNLMEVSGAYETQLYLTKEIQLVYRSQGVAINSKHIEIIVRQMTRKARILDMGDSMLLPNELIDVDDLKRINTALEKEGKRPAQVKEELLGITNASLKTKSFMSAASFQETVRMLAETAVEGKRDELEGLKECVIIGRRIPAGPASTYYDHVQLSQK